VLDKLLKLLNGFPDHIAALSIVALGASMTLFTKSHDVAPTIITAGLTMWRGNNSNSAN
jgi:hypothetical protein